ncbi:uncharacterized protein LOC142166898 [Nicotiana tabacum]|uniref:Uncharacterized protein LOC142166898 n=1 Tax=Nicotiana tabacum TaxID=4097 RepID=A0AC58SCP7_TOBAC
MEHERDDLLVVVVDLKEIIEELKRENSSGNTLKGKEVASEAHLKLENELKMGAVKGSSQRWYIDSGCSKHMTGSTDDFFSLKAMQVGSVSFGNGKKGYILEVGRVGKTLTHLIENIYYVNGIKYSLLSVSQLCNKGKKFEFLSKTCTVTNLVTGEVVLMEKRFKNIYVADFESSNSGDITCLSVVNDDVELWHRRLGYASFSLLNKLVKKDLVRGLPKPRFKDHKVCNACVRGKFTWTLFLRTKDETFSVFVAFVKKIQVKMSHNVETLEKFDAKSDEGIFLRYSSQSKAYKVYNKKTQCVEESIYVIFDESRHLCGKDSYDKNDQDGEQSKVPGEVIDMENGKADLISQVKESNKEDAAEPPADTEEPSSSITTTEAENRVDDVVQGTPNAERRNGTYSSVDANDGSHSKEPGSKTRSMFAFSTFLSQIEPKHIKEAFKMLTELLICKMNSINLRGTVYGVWFLDLQIERYRNQAPRAWYEKLSRLLLENGFTRGKIDNTLFLKKRGRNLLIVQVFVDDIIFGLQVKQTSKGTMISQQKYIKELLKRFDMESSKIIDTPITTATRLGMDEHGSPMNKTMYRGIISSLMYLTASIPDIVFRDNFDLIGYADADADADVDYAGYLVDRKSTSGMQQLEDFGVFSDFVPLLCDNTSALNMEKNLVQHKRTKRIDVRHYFLKDNVEKGVICMKFCKIEDQVNTHGSYRVNKQLITLHFGKRMRLTFTKLS